MEKRRDFRMEDFESNYRQGIRDYNRVKEQVKEGKDKLQNNQHKYIKRETEYREVIEKLTNAIKYHSTNPLEVIEEKTEEQYRLKGIDMTDPDQAAAIKRERERKEENAKLMEGATAKNIKQIND